MPFANTKFEVESDLECTKIFVKAPPLFVVPTGYTPRYDKDAAKNQNYHEGNTRVEKNVPLGDRFIVPKRSIVQVSVKFKQQIEDTGKFESSRDNMWVPVKVISLPPENEKLQSNSNYKTQSVAKNQETLKTKEAAVGSVGYLKIADLEKLEKQQDYVFIVKRESELFTQLNQRLTSNGHKALEPFALRLKETDDGYEVNQCCHPNTDKCLNYPIFEVLNVVDAYGKGVEVYEEVNSEKCFSDITNSITPIEDQFLDPIRSILSHKSLGLPDQANDLKRISSITNLNFVDSRGFVQIPVIGDGSKRTGPFNSVHYGAESGDADVYMKPDVACGFMQFLKAWDKTCKGKDSCQIEFGDASHAYHKGCTTKKVKLPDGRYKNVCANPWPHESHTNGECVDINTSRMNDGDLAPMVKLLQQLGNNVCLSNEPRLAKVGCAPMSGHDTHMHMCFPSNVTATSSSIPNKALKKACEQGVSR